MRQMLIVEHRPFQLLYLIINIFHAQGFVRMAALLKINCQKQQVGKEFGPPNVKRRGRVVAEADEGGEKLLSFFRCHLYLVGA